MSTFLVRLRPSRDELVDSIGLIVVAGLALVGFHRAFGGWEFFVAGLGGCVAATLVGHVVHRLAVPLLLKFGLTVSGFLLLAAPIALRDEALAGFLPSPDAITGVLDGIVAGWRRLLTTLPPSGGYGNLLAVPYLCGYLCGAAGVALSRTPRRLLSLLVVPGAVLVASLLFGTRTPFSVLLQGSLFACASIGWLAVRRARDHKRYLVASGRQRVLSAMVMLALVGAAGTLVGPRLPFAEANDRVVLRDRTEPPFDPRVYGSPLNAFQRYLIGPLKEEVLFRVEGIPESAFDQETGTALVRLAVMDEYDGVVWQVSPGGASSGSPRSGRFIRVGEEVPTEIDGQPVEVTVQVAALPGVWLPDIGTVTGISWAGPRGAEQRDAFRLSLASSTGLVPVPGGWQPGDEYRFTAVLPVQPDEAALEDASVNTQISADLSVDVPPALAEIASALVKGKRSAYEMAVAIEEDLRKGYYVSGDTVDGGEKNAPGHSLARLMDFLASSEPVGNAEQYAAAMAVLARAVGLPARVVMGFKVPESGEVTGADVHAWVEIALGDGWVAFDPTGTNTDRPEERERKPKPQYESQDVPPPPVVPPDADVNPNQKRDGESDEADPDEEPSSGTAIPGWVLAIAVAVMLPVLVVAVFATVVLWLKRRRRRRRRSAGQPAQQMAGGWEEFLDVARDAGLPVARTATRREAALLVGAASGPSLARGADRAVFGNAEAEPETVDQYWDDVVRAERELLEPLSWRAGLRARLSLTSLRRPR